MMEFIDLGLPSGNLWASQNIYNIFSYIWSSEEANEYIESHKEDGWVPTENDFEELLDFCDREYNVYLDGMMLTSRNNGHRIFIPGFISSAWAKLGCDGYITKDGKSRDSGLLRLVKYKSDRTKANELVQQLFMSGFQECNAVTQRKRIERVLLEMAAWKDSTWK